VPSVDNSVPNMALTHRLNSNQ
jgi:hypothetical protein